MKLLGKEVELNNEKLLDWLSSNGEHDFTTISKMNITTCMSFISFAGGIPIDDIRKEVNEDLNVAVQIISEVAKAIKTKNPQPKQAKVSPLKKPIRKIRR